MNRVKVFGLAAFALLLSSGLLFAHHGTASNYDSSKRVKVEGIVKEFWWRNPHAALFIDGESDAGTKGTFVLEMGAPAALINNYGYDRKTFQPGDQVIIHMWPSYATPTNGQLDQSRIWVNGKELQSKNGKG
jgi:Family of unknown function (DUF6152)